MRFQKLATLYVLFSLVFPITAIFAADGDLDTRFDTDGKKIIDIAGTNDGISGVAFQQDGKIVVAGRRYNNVTDFDIVVMRFNRDGSFDTSFATNGIFIKDIQGGEDFPGGVAIQSDGKIVVCGYTNDGVNPADFLLMRLNADGTLDASFDGDGIALYDSGNLDALQGDVAIQSDGKILACGTIVIAGFRQATLVRYNTDGSLDSTFDGDGIASVDVRAGNDDFRTIVIQPDGKILVTGESNASGVDNNNEDIHIERFNTDGSLDTSFDGDGKVITPVSTVGNQNDFGVGICIQPDGKIIVSGYTYNGTYYDPVLVRYNTDGSYDTTFGVNGILIASIGKSYDGGRSYIQSDGKIVVGGFFANTANIDFVLFRYNTDGSLDNTFGTNGVVATDLGNGDRLSDICLHSDGRVAVAGRTGNEPYNMAIAVYITGGDFGDAPDPSYPTLKANNGAYHIIDRTMYLGSKIDLEYDGQPNATATGDDILDTDDEDGVVFNSQFIAGQSVGLTITASTSGYLDVWMDFNGDGDWADAGEQVFSSQVLAAGANNLNVDVPAGAVGGLTYSRFRFSSTGGLSYTGLALDGEVEDYAVEILADTDGDGEPDITDGCPLDPAKIAPGACGCGVIDVDSDGDGSPDCNDGCPNDANKMFPGVCGCGTPDTDSDGDGTPDCNDGCPNDPNKTDPGTYGCGISDNDTDGDGTQDDNDNCPNDPAKTDPGICGCGVSDIDTDGDGILDCVDDDNDDDTPDDIWNDYDEDDADFCDFTPVAVSPINGAIETSLTPTFVIDYYIDPEICGEHHKTRWQISERPNFNGLTYNKNTIRKDPFSHEVAPGVLKPNTTYYWRARVWCSNGCKSLYSEPVSFTTGPDPNYDSQPGNQDNHSRGVNTVVGNAYITIETSENITFLQALDNHDQDILDGMPANMPWGLINFRIELATPGDTVQITIFFEEKAANGSVLYKYDPVEGWIDYSEHATFAPNMKSVTIEIQDGGYGDLDGVANGVIVDPCGVGTNASGGGGGSGGCFLKTTIH